MLRVAFWACTLIFGMIRGSMLAEDISSDLMNDILLFLKIIFFSSFSMIILKDYIRNRWIIIILLLTHVPTVIFLNKNMEFVFILWWMFIMLYIHIYYESPRADEVRVRTR